MFGWLWKLFERRCDHAAATTFKWRDGHGTPMVEVKCPDCGFRDSSPVIVADVEQWLP